MKLVDKDYKDILNFYKININDLKPREIKEKAEHLLATKLCKCIKNIKNKTSTTESKRIAICYNSVVRRKGLKSFKFKCKKGATFLPKKGTRKLKLIKV